MERPSNNRAKKAFCCFTLEGFGIFIGWLGIIFDVLGCFYALMMMILFPDKDLRENIVAMLFHVILILYAKRFVDGIKQRDHLKMRVYIFVLYMGVALCLLLVLLSLWFLLTLALAQNEADKNQQPFIAFAIIVFLASAIGALFEIYIFLCIVALFLNIRDENLNPGRGGENNSAAFLDPQKTANEYPHPPPYQPSCNSQVAITMN